MARINTCHIDGCDDPIIYAMVAKNGLRVGYLCEAHKEEWYDAKADHNTTLGRLDEKRGTHAVDTSGAAGRSQSDSHAARRSMQTATTRNGGGTGDRVEGRGNQDRALTTTQPARENGPTGAREKTQTLGELIVRLTAEGQAGTLTLTAEQDATLGAAVNPDRVEIRPDGIVFLPWCEYADALDQAFGRGGWTHVPDGRPMLQDGFVVWGFALFAGGQFVSYALGEHPDPGYSKMSLANRAEAAKSDALVKNCKALGIFRDLWRPSWIEEWREGYAVKVNALQGERSNQARHLWRRVDRRPFFREIDRKSTGETEYSKPPRLKDEADAHMDAIAKEGRTGSKYYDTGDPGGDHYPDGED